MGELKLKIPDGLEKRFREYAFKKYGFKKGALSMAAEKILAETVRGEASKKKDLFLKSIGGWKDVDADALIKRIYESRTVSARKQVELE